MYIKNAVAAYLLLIAFSDSAVLAQGYSQSYEPPSNTAEKAVRVAASAQGAPTSTNSSNSGSRSGLKAFPLKVLGFVTGCAVGVPVSVVRNPISEEKWSIDNWTGDNKDKPRVTVPAGLFWAPFAVIDGVILAPFSAVKYSAKNFNKPFSKEQFGLGQRGQ